MDSVHRRDRAMLFRTGAALVFGRLGMADGLAYGCAECLRRYCESDGCWRMRSVVARDDFAESAGSGAGGPAN